MPASSRAGQSLREYCQSTMPATRPSRTRTFPAWKSPWIAQTQRSSASRPTRAVPRTPAPMTPAFRPGSSPTSRSCPSSGHAVKTRRDVARSPATPEHVDVDVRATPAALVGRAPRETAVPRPRETERPKRRGHRRHRRLSHRAPRVARPPARSRSPGTEEVRAPISHSRNRRVPPARRTLLLGRLRQSFQREVARGAGEQPPRSDRRWLRGLVRTLTLT